MCFRILNENECVGGIFQLVTHIPLGYLAASQCFHEGIDVAMLATNLVKKDILSIQTHESSIALSSLSCFLTQDLAMDLANDIMALMISTKPIIRYARPIEISRRVLGANT